MVHNKKTIITGLQTHFKRNHNIERDLFDYQEHIDGNLSYQENYTIIKQELKKRGLLR